MPDHDSARPFFAYLEKFIDQYDEAGDVPTSVSRVAMRSLLSIWQQRVPHVDPALMEAELRRINDILLAFRGWLSYASHLYQD